MFTPKFAGRRRKAVAERFGFTRRCSSIHVCGCERRSVPTPVLQTNLHETITPHKTSNKAADDLETVQNLILCFILMGSCSIFQNKTLALFCVSRWRRWINQQEEGRERQEKGCREDNPACSKFTPVPNPLIPLGSSGRDFIFYFRNNGADLFTYLHPAR